LPQRVLEAEHIAAGLSSEEARRRIGLHLQDAIDPRPTPGLERAEAAALAGWCAQDTARLVLDAGAEDAAFRRRLVFVAYLRMAHGRYPSEGPGEDHSAWRLP